MPPPLSFDAAPLDPDEAWVVLLQGRVLDLERLAPLLIEEGIAARVERYENDPMFNVSGAGILGVSETTLAGVLHVARAQEEAARALLDVLPPDQQPWDDLPDEQEFPSSETTEDAHDIDPNDRGDDHGESPRARDLVPWLVLVGGSSASWPWCVC